jgi:hypothetical protein
LRSQRAREDGGWKTVNVQQREGKKGESKFEVIIILVRANPEPEVIAVALTRDSAVVATDFDCEYAALLFKAQRWMSRIRLEKSEIFVGELLNMLRKPVIALPERRQRM